MHVAFYLLTLADTDLARKPLSERRTLLKSALRQRTPFSYHKTSRFQQNRCLRWCGTTALRRLAKKLSSNYKPVDVRVHCPRCATSCPKRW